MRYRVLASLLYPIMGALLTFPAVAQPSEDHNERKFGWSVGTPLKKGKKSPPPVRPVYMVPNVPDDGEIKIDTDLVLNDIIVFDKKGRPITGLKAADFQVLEDGVPQEIGEFSIGGQSIPRSVVLIIDHSLSQYLHIEKSVAAAKVLVDSLGPNDEMAVVTDNIEIAVDSTMDKERLRSGLDALRIRAITGNFGMSQQYSALYAVLNEMYKKNGKRQVIIFQTDGDQYFSLLPYIPTRKPAFAFDDMMEAAERNGTTIYTVFTGAAIAGRSDKQKEEMVRQTLSSESLAYSLTHPERPPIPPSKFTTAYVAGRRRQIEREEEAVATVAKRSGGLAQTLDTADRANEVYGNILKDMDQRYIIGYYPSQMVRDGRRREVTISVRGRSEYKVWGRTSYIAPMGTMAVSPK